MKITEECKKCNYWTRDPNHGNFKCYCGNCPAKARDIKLEQINKLKSQQEHRDRKALLDDY